MTCGYVKAGADGPRLVPMNFLDKLAICRVFFWHILKLFFVRQLEYVPQELLTVNSKFVSVKQACSLVSSGSTVLSCGMAANHRCTIFFWGLRARFEESQTPKGLTWVCVGGQGGRGSGFPGTAEELSHPGLLTRLICAHLETFKAQLRLADKVTALPTQLRSPLETVVVDLSFVEANRAALLASGYSFLVGCCPE